MELAGAGARHRTANGALIFLHYPNGLLKEDFAGKCGKDAAARLKHCFTQVFAFCFFSLRSASHHARTASASRLLGGAHT